MRGLRPRRSDVESQPFQQDDLPPPPPSSKTQRRLRHEDLGEENSLLNVGFEARVSARAAGEARAAVAARMEPFEKRLTQDVESARRGVVELRTSSATLSAEVSAQRREIASCAKVGTAQELALEVMRHEYEACRARLAKLETDRADTDAWRSRMESDLSHLRVSREAAQRDRDALAIEVQALRAQVYGTSGDKENTTVGGVVAQAQLQAHAAVAAAMAPMQAHFERELAVVRRHVAALRAGATLNNLKEEDVPEALETMRPSELALKGIVASEVADCEQRLEDKVATILEAKFTTSLEAKAAKLQKDAEEGVFSKLKAEATKKSGFLFLGDNDFKRDTAIFKMTTEAISKRVEEVAKNLGEVQKTQSAASEKLTTELTECRSSLKEITTSMSTTKNDTQHATRSLRELMESTEIATRKRFEKDRLEFEARLTHLRDEVITDVAELRRQHGKANSALGALDDRFKVVREAATSAAEDAPGVRRAALAAARLDAVEEQLATVETRVGPKLDASFAEADAQRRSLAGRLDTVEHFLDGSEQNGAKDRLESLEATGAQRTRALEAALQRVKTLEDQVAPLRADAEKAPLQRLARVENDVESTRKRAEDVASDMAKTTLRQQRALDVAKENLDARTTQLATRILQTEEHVANAANLKIRVQAVENDSADARRTFAKAHADLASQSNKAYEAATAKFTATTTEYESHLTKVRAIAQAAILRADQCATDLAGLFDDPAVDRKQGGGVPAVTPAVALPGEPLWGVPEEPPPEQQPAAPSPVDDGQPSPVDENVSSFTEEDEVDDGQVSPDWSTQPVPQPTYVVEEEEEDLDEELLDGGGRGEAPPQDQDDDDDDLSEEHLSEADEVAPPPVAQPSQAEAVVEDVADGEVEVPEPSAASSDEHEEEPLEASEEPGPTFTTALPEDVPARLERLPTMDDSIALEAGSWDDEDDDDEAPDTVDETVDESPIRVPEEPEEFRDEVEASDSEVEAIGREDDEVSVEESEEAVPVPRRRRLANDFEDDGFDDIPDIPMMDEIPTIDPLESVPSVDTKVTEAAVPAADDVNDDDDNEPSVSSVEDTGVDEDDETEDDETDDDNGDALASFVKVRAITCFISHPCTGYKERPSAGLSGSPPAGVGVGVERCSPGGTGFSRSPPAPLER